MVIIITEEAVYLVILEGIQVTVILVTAGDGACRGGPPVREAAGGDGSFPSGGPPGPPGPQEP